MAKELVINTSGLNSFGSRVLTPGLDITQYNKNPVLLWMHQRHNNWMPIGRMENLRFDGDRLIGTPVFDMDDEFAAKIANKWEKGILNMCSASVEILQTSVDPSVLLPGQTRATVVRGKLVEVSIVDIGSNDDALKLTNSGKLLELSAGEVSEVLPLLNLDKQTTADNSAKSNNNNKKMNKETLLKLGLPETATDEQVDAAVAALHEKAQRADTLELSNITAAVDAAVKEKRITADKREHFISLGKAAGFAALSETLAVLQPARKPNEVINMAGDTPVPVDKKYLKLSDVPTGERLELRKNNPAEYARLYKEEYGVDCPTLK